MTTANKHLTLKKLPSMGLPSYSSTKLLRQMGQESGALVREAEPREVIEDHRSLFFNDEFKNEEKKDRSWFLK
jgi:hypothetical protein